MAAKRHFKERLNLHGVFTGNRNMEVLEHNVAATSAEVRKSTRPHKINDFGSEWICEDLNLPGSSPSMHQKNNLNNLVSYTKNSSIMENEANSDFTKKAVLHESNIKIKKRKRGRPSKQISQNNNDPTHGSNIQYIKQKRGRPSKQISQNNNDPQHGSNIQNIKRKRGKPSKQISQNNNDPQHGSNIQYIKRKRGRPSKQISQNNNDPQHGSNIQNKKRKRGRPSKQISQNVENVNENINHNLNQSLDVSLIELPTKGNGVNIDSKHGSNIEKEKLKQGELSKKINQNIVLEVNDAPDLFGQSSINSAVIVTDTATKVETVNDNSAIRESVCNII